MKKINSLKLLWNYIKDDKFKVFIYILLLLITYLPALVAAYFWGKALEVLIIKDLSKFFMYLGTWSLIFIICYGILQIPKNKLYNYFEIKFMSRASHDLYSKIDKLPAIAFEEIGVGKFINRLYNDIDRVMSLANSLIKLICKSFVLIFILVLTFYISWILGLELILFGIIMGFISYKYFPKIKEKQEVIKKQSDDYIKTATENITGIREIKALGIEKNIEKNIFTNLKELFMKYGIISLMD